MNYKQLINFDNYYIYDDGRIYSIKSRKFLNPYNIRGYLKIDLYSNNKRNKFFVHRLVYETFKGQIPEGLQIDHINGIRDDNRLENLRLLTSKENIKNYHCSEQYKEVDKEFYEKNREKYKEYNRKYKENHKEEIKIKRREYYQKYKK